MVSAILIGLGTAVARNLGGWFKNSIEDGKIQDYEIKKLVISTAVVAVIFTGTYYGLEVLNQENSEWISSAFTLVLSPIIDAVIKKFKKE